MEKLVAMEGYEDFADTSVRLLSTRWIEGRDGGVGGG